MTGAIDATELKNRIIASLERQGFEFQGGELILPSNPDKQTIRNLHAEATRHRIERSSERLKKKEKRLLQYIASGREVTPTRIAPRLVEVKADSDEELIFRYVALHWSIPVSSGYGRRLRFLVIDESNEKLIGIIGVGDPVFSLAARDQWIGWSKEQRRSRLQYVLDAFALGAVPPYSYLLCGKLVAMLAASEELRLTFERKYRNGSSIISKRELTGQIVVITTNSALGRSSIYNRLKFDGRSLFKSVGFTRGSGDFHFSNGLYDEIRQYAVTHCQPTSKHATWGTGFRNRREVVRKVLGHLGLSRDWQYHGVQREVFVVPLARNSLTFLNETDVTPDYYCQPASDLFASFKQRWLLPRAAGDRRYCDFNPESYMIFNFNQNENPLSKLD